MGCVIIVENLLINFERNITTKFAKFKFIKAYFNISKNKIFYPFLLLKFQESYQ